ncbi:CCA tRNA nucleotidyltransferase [Bacillus solimangrovi]|uniref:CCA-adding enzyme n=1 Tax=Bacillus solimangrovi TaxID=1305675 RepID=A0A1E5LHA1_9BACI|nr:CCA tRNA nucleotidyltransferase [Bacillus solimangrovi]OEH93426.1 CCA tRNA nucleotidyltransferase [Bacillus solimangrovi]
MNHAFTQALPVIERLNEAGYEAFFVGGSVRDSLLQRQIGDIDIATSASPQTVMGLFEKTIPVGIEHGTVIVGCNEEYYEVTTFRREDNYEDFRHPNAVEFITSIEEDLSRRDFTINSIAMDKNGQLQDPFRGQADISNQILRTVGNPHDRFNEDPLRIMRAVRFISQLGFHLEDDTKSAMIVKSELLNKIAIERVAVEFEKLLGGAFVNEALTVLLDTGVYAKLPSLSGEYERLLECMQFDFTKLCSIEEHWSLFLYVLNVQDVRSFLREWKCSNKLINEVAHLLNCISQAESSSITSMLLYQVGEAHLEKFARLYALVNHVAQQEMIALCREQFRSLPLYSRKQLVVNGNDLIGWFDRGGGPWMSEMLEKIERAVVNKKVDNDKETIREWLQQ